MVASGKIPGLLSLPAPSVTRLFGGEGSLDFAVSYHVAEMTDRFRVQHELRRRVLERLQRENIAMRASAQVASPSRGLVQGRADELECSATGFAIMGVRAGGRRGAGASPPRRGDKERTPWPTLLSRPGVSITWC